MINGNRPTGHKRNGIEKTKISLAITIMLISLHFCLLLSRPDSYKWSRVFNHSKIITKKTLSKQIRPLAKHDYKQYAFCILALVSAIYLFRTLNDD